MLKSTKIREMLSPRAKASSTFCTTKVAQQAMKAARIPVCSQKRFVMEDNL